MGVGAAGEAEGAALQGGERLAAALRVRAAGGKDMQEIARRAGRTERPWGSERVREKAEQGARREAVAAGEISRARPQSGGGQAGRPQRHTPDGAWPRGRPRALTGGERA